MPQAALDLHRSSGWAPRIRCSSSTPRAAPASRRACCTPPAATWSTPRCTHKLVFDYHPGDVYFCAADIGWITGHSYIVYGPLANGATTVMFESTPLYPDPGRYWRMVDDLGVNIFYTAPTALRAHRARPATSWVKRYKRDVAAHPRHGRRADQPRGLALVPRRRRRRPLRGGRHLVADRDRRHPDHAAARASRRPSPARRRCRSSASSR